MHQRLVLTPNQSKSSYEKFTNSAVFTFLGLKDQAYDIAVFVSHTNIGGGAQATVLPARPTVVDVVLR